MYLFLVVDGQGVSPKANIPTVAFPAAAPNLFAVVAEVAEQLVLQAYKYLFLVDLIPAGAHELYPIANMPLVEFPAATAPELFILDAIAEQLVSLEYVYLFLVVVGL